MGSEGASELQELEAQTPTPAPAAAPVSSRELLRAADWRGRGGAALMPALELALHDVGESPGVDASPAGTVPGRLCRAESFSKGRC